jgi:hypothetical protein
MMSMSAFVEAPAITCASGAANPDRSPATAGTARAHADAQAKEVGRSEVLGDRAEVLAYDCHEGNMALRQSLGAERAEDRALAEDQKKGGNDMKAEGKEDRGGMKSEQKAEQKSEKGQTTGQGTTQRDQSTTQRDQTQREQTTTQGRDQPSRDQKAQGQDRMQTQTQGGAAGQSTTTTGQAGAGAM